MKNSRRDKPSRTKETHHTRETAYVAPVKITDAMWREASENGAKAKEMLRTMNIGGKGDVKFVKLANGNQIPVEEVTEKQAQDFISMLAPERVWKGFRQ